ncbi:MAG: hypothetical protein ACSHYA_14365 [Opitutaceae bacterium]
MDSSQDDDTDALIERALRLGDLRKDIMDRVGENCIESGTENLSMDMQETFLQHVLDFEAAEDSTFFERLHSEAKFVPVSPDHLCSEEQCHAALWDLINKLASLRVFLNSTDHLDDASLYRLLYFEALEGATVVPPAGSEWNCRIDAAEFGTKEDPDGTNIWLRYYADEQTRDEWDGEVPPKETPPFDRDRLLPVPPEERAGNG